MLTHNIGAKMRTVTEFSEVFNFVTENFLLTDIICGSIFQITDFGGRCKSILLSQTEMMYF